MTIKFNNVKEIQLAEINEKSFTRCFVGCLILTVDHKILLQQRGEQCKSYPGFLSEFGGHIEEKETPIQALVRELHEELGAQVEPSEVVNLGAITEKSTNYSELIYVYFWHDKKGTITGCYEEDSRSFDNVEAIFSHPKVMDSVYWLIQECQKKKLFSFLKD